MRPSELIDDHHLAILDNVFNVALEQHMRPQRRHHMVHQDDVVGIVKARPLLQQAGLSQHLLNMLMALLAEESLARLLVYRVVARTEVGLALLVGNRLLPDQATG